MLTSNHYCVTTQVQCSDLSLSEVLNFCISSNASHTFSRFHFAFKRHFILLFKSVCWFTDQKAWLLKICTDINAEHHETNADRLYMRCNACKCARFHTSALGCVSDVCIDFFEPLQLFLAPSFAHCKTFPCKFTVKYWQLGCQPHSVFLQYCTVTASYSILL